MNKLFLIAITLLILNLGNVANAQISNPVTNPQETTTSSTLNKAIIPAKAPEYQSIILSWEPINGAVSYNLLIADEKGNLKYEKKDIFPTGYQINPQELHLQGELYYQIQGVDYYKQPVAPLTDPKPLFQGLHFNRYWQEMQPKHQKGETTSSTTRNYLVEKDVLIPPLKLTGEFAQMRLFPVYPVFSWVKVPNATDYTITVEKIISPQVFKPVETIHLKDTYDFYGSHAYVDAGDYRYQVVATHGKNKLAQSPWTYFHVVPQAKIVALGDSITHGGGAISTPPSQLLYNWESYVNYPIINAGYSGNTTASMLQRLNRDVFTFQPQYLILMGGINDLRAGTSAQVVIANLKNIQAQAKARGIHTILLTTPPLNYQMTSKYIATPASNWQWELKTLNDWILQQPNHLDIAKDLTDEHGELKAAFTTDGLHPDGAGKALIGKAVNDYLESILPKEGN